MTQTNLTPGTPERPFGRILTAMVTPFTPDGEKIDFDAAQRLAVHLVDQGNDGLVVSGTTGESATTTEHEKKDLLRAVVEAVGDRARVIAGAGSNDTPHSVLLAKDAAEVGADGLLVVTPYYNKPTQEGVYQHMMAVANATDLPVMLYDIPGRSGIPITADTIKRCAEHERVLAMKDAKGDIHEGTCIMNETGLAYYSGDDVINLPWMAAGAAGIVSVVTHVATPLYKQMLDAVDANDLREATRIHRAVAPVVTAVMTRLPGVMTAKAGLELQGVLAHRVMRLPLVPATDAEVEQLRADLATVAGVL
ncbi:4-hydroxy-tetrahydrodipicolinate synthase [Micrococcales bacterium 31B]|nr:4-hydroxy-tetrahydrodipicolinate synthase [Micrococcales bacterium 31B]